MSNPFPRIPYKLAQEVPGLKLSGAAQSGLTPTTTPAQFLASLIEKQLFDEALKFVGMALPGREAAWWAVQCLKPTTPKGSELTAILLAEQAVIAHKAEASAAAFQAGQEVSDTAAGLAASAAYLAGPSVTVPPPGGSPVPPANGAANRLAIAALTVATLAPEPPDRPTRLRQYLALAIAVAAGTNRWPE